MKLTPILSLAQLDAKSRKDPRYAQLAIDAASNLGAGPNLTRESAMKFLEQSAAESDEDAVVEEINFLIV